MVKSERVRIASLNAGIASAGSDAILMQVQLQHFEWHAIKREHKIGSIARRQFPHFALQTR